LSSHTLIAGRLPLYAQPRQPLTTPQVTTPSAAAVLEALKRFPREGESIGATIDVWVITPDAPQE
jgi:hypothetical protein